MWAAIVYLAIASPFLFMLFVYVIQTMDRHRRQLPVRPVPDRLRDRRRAPAGRGRDVSLLLGAPLVLAGVYIGALSRLEGIRRRRPAGHGSGRPRPTDAAEFPL